ncbi:hypothetical protein BOTBODRAFT_37819 [Botryobasidium botryosum FD-172 SS1]|uniref:Uncharacterized protein n=1 Tax=Botryobasidium botryosum (strain FD-172 SS1) TaxID=930990 RepID=A0A067M1D6_BOTB1|nr:hypothetical protein BOTBODRAFT_37819 [Botryobasidium botryosum FD-172 SS1]
MAAPVPVPVFSLVVYDPVYIEYLVLQINILWWRAQVTCVQQRANKLSSLFDAAMLAGPSTVLLLKPYIEQESTAIQAEYAALEDKVKMSEEKIEQRSHDYVVAAIAWKSKKCYRKVRIVNALLGKNDPLIIMLGPAGEEVPEWFARTHAEIEQLEGKMLDHHLQFYGLKVEGSAAAMRHALLAHLGRR